MENKKPMNSQKISGLRKAIYLILGIIIGALVWFIAGYFYLIVVGMAANSRVDGILIMILSVYILPIAVMAWLLSRATKKKLIIIGMLLFFAVVFLIPGPCSISILLQ